MRERAFRWDALSRRLEQARAIRYPGIAQLLLGFVDEMRQIGVGCSVRAALNVGGAEGGQPDIAERARESSRKAGGARHRGEHGKPIVPRCFEGRARRHSLERQRARRRDAAPREPRCGNPRRELRQAEPRQADGGRTGPRDRSSEVVSRAARGGDDGQWL